MNLSVKDVPKKVERVEHDYHVDGVTVSVESGSSYDPTQWSGVRQWHCLSGLLVGVPSTRPGDDVVCVRGGVFLSKCTLVQGPRTVRSYPSTLRSPTLYLRFSEVYKKSPIPFTEISFCFFFVMMYREGPTFLSAYIQILSCTDCRDGRHRRVTVLVPVI